MKRKISRKREVFRILRPSAIFPYTVYVRLPGGEWYNASVHRTLANAIKKATTTFRARSTRITKDSRLEFGPRYRVWSSAKGKMKMKL